MDADSRHILEILRSDGVSSNAGEGSYLGVKLKDLDREVLYAIIEELNGELGRTRKELMQAKIDWINSL